MLRGQGRAITIDRVVNLGAIEFRSTSLECWDPVQQMPVFTFTAPSPRARVSVCFDDTNWARVVKLQFGGGAVTRWSTGPAGSSSFGTLVVTRRGTRRSIEHLEFDNWWDEVFDAEFDSSDGAALGAFALEDQRVRFLAWNDQQMGGALYRGKDSRGRTVALLFDAVRR